MLVKPFLRALVVSAAVCIPLATGVDRYGTGLPALLGAISKRNAWNEHATRHEILGDAGWAAPLLPRYISAVDMLRAIIGPGAVSPMANGPNTDPRLQCRSLSANYNASARGVMPTRALCGRNYDLVMLNTYPNSGTTWTMAVFGPAAGYKSEAVYRVAAHVEQNHDGGVRSWGPPPHRRGRAPALIKSHHTTAAACATKSTGTRHCHASRVLHYMRDPLDNLIARWKYVVQNAVVDEKGTPMHRWSRGQSADEFRALWLPYLNDGARQLSAGMLATFEDFALNEVSTYIHWHCQAIEQSRGLPTKLVHYEQLLDDPWIGGAGWSPGGF